MKASEMFPVKCAPSKVEQPKMLTAGVWTGKLVDLVEESGKTNNREWTRYTIEGEGRVAFTSFSHTDALLAQCAIDGEDVVEIQWELNSFGGKTLFAIDPAPEDDPLVAEPVAEAIDEDDIPF